MTVRQRGYVALVVVLAVVAAACGDDEAEPVIDAPAEPTAEATDAPDGGEADPDEGAAVEADPDEGAAVEADPDEGAATETEPAPDVAVDSGVHPLAAACPSPLRVQTDWFPEAEHGATYQLIGASADIDSSAGIYRGPIIDPFTGEDTGVMMEIRAGGPFLGDQTTEQVMYTDPGIQFGFSTTSLQLDRWERFPVVTVVAPLEISPGGVMWDSDQNDFETFADIKASGLPVFYFGVGNVWIDWLAWAGELDPDQLDGSWDGSPIRYATENIVQSAFVSNQPYTYEFDIPNTAGRPIEWLLAHDAGYETYQGAIAVKPDFLAEEADCLELIVPMWQQAAIDFVEDPGPVSTAMVQYVDDLASFWILSEGLNQFAVDTMVSAGLVGNGPDGILGNFDPDRMQQFWETYVEFAADFYGAEITVTVGELYTNEFIDPTIGM